MKVTQEVFKTTRDNIVVVLPELKLTTDSGIELTERQLKEEAKTRLKFYEVVAVGEETKEVKVGDYVLVNRYTEFPVELVEPKTKGTVLGVAREYDVVGYYTK